MFAKSSTDYIKCVLNSFAWEHRQLALEKLYLMCCLKILNHVCLSAFPFTPNSFWVWISSCFVGFVCRKTDISTDIQNNFWKAPLANDPHTRTSSFMLNVQAFCKKKFNDADSLECIFSFLYLMKQKVEPLLF